MNNVLTDTNHSTPRTVLNVQNLILYMDKKIPLMPFSDLNIAFHTKQNKTKTKHAIWKKLTFNNCTGDARGITLILLHVVIIN